jgi:hypothetical protein
VSNRTFVAGLVVCVAIMLALGGAIALLNAGNNRPEGVAEDWLTAIGDTTRKGVEADATRRADKIGAPELAHDLLYPYAKDIDRKSGFKDLEVGKAVEERANTVRVGFHLTARVPDDETKELTGVITMEKADDEWHVTGVQVVDPVSVGLPALPSDGGPPPSSAPLSLWLGALVGSALIGVVTASLVRAAGRTTDAHAALA